MREAQPPGQLVSIQNPWVDIPSSPPFVVPSDAPCLTPDLIFWSQLHLEHLPVPFIGDPRKASVILLGLNPSWVPRSDLDEPGDYADQPRLPLSFSSRIPFFCLDEQFSHTAGYRWWWRRLRLLIESCGVNVISRRVACVEWFPYRSPTFRRLPKVLPSQSYGFELVRAAAQRGAVVVVMRSLALWLSAVPELAAHRLVQMRVPRSPYVTPRNLGADGFGRVQAGLKLID